MIELKIEYAFVVLSVCNLKRVHFNVVPGLCFSYIFKIIITVSCS